MSNIIIPSPPPHLIPHIKHIIAKLPPDFQLYPPRPLSSLELQHLNNTFDYIWDESEGRIADPTHQRLRLIEEAFRTGHPDGVFMKGLVSLGRASRLYLLMAEELGCTHPRLNLCMGISYYKGYYDEEGYCEGRNIGTAAEYFEKSIGGMLHHVFEPLCDIRSLT